MSELLSKLSNIEKNERIEKSQIIKDIIDFLKAGGYSIYSVDADRPWGGFVRLNNDNAKMFIDDFFPEISIEEARLGRPDVELSPKLLLVSPRQRLSWQYHNNRAERWHFITPGAYIRSLNDKEGEIQLAASGDVVQFSPGERHRLIGGDDNYTLAAEIWQHTDQDMLSSEDDIVRLEDDYGRD